MFLLYKWLKLSKVRISILGLIFQDNPYYEKFVVYSSENLTFEQRNYMQMLK